MKKKYVYILLLFLCLDLGYSLLQHYHVSLDGDLASIILPSERYQQVMDNPLGLDVILKNETYPSPNRFFAHWFTSEYFKNVPLFLQNFTSPINSVYLASGIIKTLVQFLLILLLATYIIGQRKFGIKNLIIVAALVSPLFQSSGYYHYMGVIDKATTYTLFYAFPLGLLLLFFYPFYKKIFLRKEVKMSSVHFLLLLGMTIYLSLNGPIIPPIVLLSAAIIFVAQSWNAWQEKGKLDFGKYLSSMKNGIGAPQIFLLMVFCIFSLYSFYIGLNNSEGSEKVITVAERYQRMPEGVFNMLTQKLGFPILLLTISINLFLIKKFAATDESKTILTFLKWLLIFSVVYILLLPLGGYRDYRPNIIRRDTFLPITLFIFYAYGITSFYLINHLVPKYKRWYVGFLILLGINFTLVDLPDFENNDCERNALEKISKASGGVVKLDNDCYILNWMKLGKAEDSKVNSELLQLWNITEEPTLYFQK